MKEYKDKKITEINRVEVGIKCDNCKKIIKNENDYKRTYLQQKHYYEVTTHHHGWGNDSIESYEYYDFCNEKCLFEFLKKYYNGSEGTLCCEIEEIRI